MHTIAKFTLWTAALLVVSAQLASSAACNDDGFHCIGSFVYQLCLDDSPTTNTDPMECPATTRCSPDCNEPCLPESNIPCKKCNSGNFRCANETSFQVCVEASKPPYPDVYNCVNGTFCSDFCPTQCSVRKCNPVTCTTDGEKFEAQNPKNYYLCSLMPDNTYIVVEYPCPGTANFDKTTKNCAEPTTTPRPPFNCPDVGRYPDPSSVTSFYVCALSGNEVKSTRLDCPPGTTFNKDTLKCSSTGSPTSTQITLSTPPAEFVCTAVGKFADPNSCYNFILCTSTDEDELMSTTYTCPNTSFYNHDTLKCTNTRPSNCPVEPRIALESIEFECPGVGRFEDPDSCDHYYLCVEEEGDFLNTDNYRSIHFPCPDSSRYNPETQQCTFFDIPCMK